MTFDCKSGVARVLRSDFEVGSQSGSTPWLSWQQTAPDHVQIGQGEHGEQTRRVLGQASVAHLGETPQLLDDAKCMFAAGSSGRSEAVYASPVRAERAAAQAAPIHPIS